MVWKFIFEISPLVYQMFYEQLLEIIKNIMPRDIIGMVLY